MRVSSDEYVCKSVWLRDAARAERGPCTSARCEVQYVVARELAREVCGLSACPVVRARDVRSRQSLSPQALRPLSERESRQRPRECGTQRRPDAAREGSGERSNLVGCVMPLDDAQGSAAAGGEQGQAKPELSVSFFEFGCVRVQRGRQRWGRARPHFGQKPSREGAQSLGCCWRCGRSWRCGRAL